MTAQKKKQRRSAKVSAFAACCVRVAKLLLKEEEVTPCAGKKRRAKLSGTQRNNQFKLYMRIQTYTHICGDVCVCQINMCVDEVGHEGSEGQTGHQDGKKPRP